MAKGLISYYDGDQPGKIPGILPGPPPSGDYYWGEAGQMWNTLIAYAQATGDSSYNDLISKGLLWQTGPNNNFLPPNWTASLGNDDQGMWGMAAMTAAETNFTAGPSNNWLDLAKNVFENLASPDRWNATGEDSCGGGLRWQVLAFNAGYDYKNSISTGVLFNLAARLARLTGNATYAEWADRTWTWMEDVGFMTADGAIYDGAHVATNCTDINKAQFSYTLGVFIEGAAHMYNSTGGKDEWKNRLSTLVNNGTSYFTDGDKCVPVEPSCEADGRCTTDMLAFKSVLLRGLSAAAQFAPYTVGGKVGCVLGAAAGATAEACGDGDKGAQCGFAWTAGKDDGLHGAGQQMNALAALTGEYRLRVAPAAGGSAAAGNGSSTGGSSGSGSPTQSGAAPTNSKSGAGVTADRAGAGFLLAAGLLAVGFTALLA